MVRLFSKIEGLSLIAGLVAMGGAMLSCGSNEIDPIGPFYPELNEGLIWEYEVNEVQKYANVDSDITYEEKNEITDKYVLNGKEFFTVKSYIRLAKTAPWTYSGSYVLSTDETGVYKTEVEVKSQLLGYPLYKGQSWKSNHSIITTSHNSSVISEVNVPFVYLSDTLKSGIKVIEKFDSTGIANFQQYKVYDTGLGMVYSEVKDIQYCQETDDCLGKGIVTFNHTVKKTLIATNAIEIPAQ